MNEPIPTESNTNLSTAALVLGIVAACIGLIPIVGFFAIPCGILAIIFGVKGIRRNVQRNFALAGLITGCVGLVLSFVGMALLGNAIDENKKETEDCVDAIFEDLGNGGATQNAVEACDD
jgi:hypothetical protein